jgi:hypothetical protein
MVCQKFLIPSFPFSSFAKAAKLKKGMPFLHWNTHHPAKGTPLQKPPLLRFLE